MHNTQYWIKQLQLEPHPEGGYYRRIYQSQQLTPTANGDRHTATVIHYLLENHDFSAWHKIQHDELWFHHQGQAIIIRCINEQGVLIEKRLGPEYELSICVPGKTWFCSELIETTQQNAYSLVSCMVSPGFDFADFEIGNKTQLVRIFPQHKDIIERLCRE